MYFSIFALPLTSIYIMLITHTWSNKELLIGCRLCTNQLSPFWDRWFWARFKIPRACFWSRWCWARSAGPETGMGYSVGLLGCASVPLPFTCVRNVLCESGWKTSSHVSVMCYVKVAEIHPVFLGEWLGVGSDYDFFPENINFVHEKKKSWFWT